jgi:SAM-dependent methyltransferase
VTGLDWEERITRDTSPAIRIEHRVRYAIAAPIVAAAPVWADLGCGNGIAAREALGDRLPEDVLLVDNSEEALAQAPRELDTKALTTLQADLTSSEDLDRIRQQLVAEGVRGGCVTAFEVVEHLTSFVPLIELLVDLDERHGFTSVLSVPNDAFWSVENPFHVTTWGEGAFEELRRVLPAEHVVAHQHALQGSVGVIENGDREPETVAVEPAAVPVPTHFLVAFGPAAARLRGAAAVAGADLVEQRRWERQRDSNYAHLQARERTHYEELKKRIAEMDDWRRYIHELEGKLGIPPSGTGNDDSG